MGKFSHSLKMCIPIPILQVGSDIVSPLGAVPGITAGIGLGGRHGVNDGSQGSLGAIPGVGSVLSGNG